MSHFEVEKFDCKELNCMINEFYNVKNKADQWKHLNSIVVPVNLIPRLEKLKQFKVFEDDVFVISFPRSGTTITQEMTWLMMNDFDFETAKNVVLDERFPELEYDEDIQMFSGNDVIVDTFAGLKRPRMIKTHLPVQLLPDEVWTKYPKLIYISREPKDVVVSMFHFFKDIYYCDISLERFMDLFMEDKVLCCPLKDHRENYWNIINGYPNILYLTYEEVLQNTDAILKKVASFLGKTINDDERQQLKEHLAFENMQKNKACNNEFLLKQSDSIVGKERNDVNRFIRKGTVGGYRDEMSEVYAARFDKWMNNKETL